MTLENLLGEWARLLVASLAASGVRDVVISPGSRSTPFTWAVLQHPALRCRVLIDERSAAFFALGNAKVTGIPTALVCTSGSALANYFPAVVEASLSGTPLVILSADRPFELQDCGAAQTIDQTKIFGSFVRGQADLGMPEPVDAALRGLMRAVARHVERACTPFPGPVHLNARARKPLEPKPARSAEERDLERRVSLLIEHGPARAEPVEAAPSPSAIRRLADACASTERGLIVVGPSPIPERLGGVAASALLDLARLTGYPLLCEATSQVRFASPPGAVCDAFDWLCRSSHFAAAAKPELIVQFGRPPTSSGFEQYLSRHPSTARHLVAPFDWPDPHGQATSIVRGHPPLVVRALASALAERRVGAAARDEITWARLWKRGNDLAWQIVDAALAEDAALSEAAAMRAVLDALPRPGLLAVGNSLPIRELDWFCRARSLDAMVWCQRGANGIDGLVSGALGAAEASGRAASLLVGDVSFLHDVGGLYAARETTANLTIVVLNNRGGRIFEQLPIAQNATGTAPDLRAWTTPHTCELEHAARLYGLPFTSVGDGAALKRALEAGEQRVRVVEVRVGEPSVTWQVHRIAARIDQRLLALCNDLGAVEKRP